MFDLPKISCICSFPEKGNLNSLKKTIKYFNNQNYKNKELIVLSQSGLSKEIKDFVSNENIIVIEVPKRLNNYSVLNLAVEIGTGTIICQWDYNDHYHPFRLTSQYKSILSRDSIASFYNQFFQYENNKMFWLDLSKEKPLWKSMLPCSAMFYKHVFETYKGKLYNEDFMIKLSKIGLLRGLNFAYQYIYCKKTNGRILDSKELKYNQDLILKNLSYYEFDENISFYSCDEFVFEKEKNVI